MTSLIMPLSLWISCFSNYKKEFERIFGICVIQVCLKATLSLCQATIGNRQSCSSVAFDRLDTVVLFLTRCDQDPETHLGLQISLFDTRAWIFPQELEKVRSVVGAGRQGPEVEKEYKEHNAIMKFATGELMLSG